MCSEFVFKKHYLTVKWARRKSFVIQELIWLIFVSFYPQTTVMCVFIVTGRLLRGQVSSFCDFRSQLESIQWHNCYYYDDICSAINISIKSMGIQETWDLVRKMIYELLIVC